MRRKTEEELKAGNRVRQKRWRDKHKWTGQQRKLACYGKSKAQLAGKGVITLPGPAVKRKKVTLAPLPKYGDNLVVVSTDSVEGDAQVMAAHAEGVQRRMGVGGPSRSMEPEQKGGHGREGMDKSVGERDPGIEGGGKGGQDKKDCPEGAGGGTGEEGGGVYARRAFGELKAAHGVQAGVEVEME